eukprot:2452158-Pyramimonas_sp.AAC.1
MNIPHPPTNRSPSIGIYTSPTDQSQSLKRNIPHPPTNRSPACARCERAGTTGKGWVAMVQLTTLLWLFHDGYKETPTYVDNQQSRKLGPELAEGGLQDTNGCICVLVDCDGLWRTVLSTLPVPRLRR